ncbi:MAG: uncharacterized protein JWP61_1825 [Friedmanniella sp.]|nr:uncharacterized protein [Friedmanniella sp.]
MTKHDMKKTALAALAVGITLSLAACGGSDMGDMGGMTPGAAPMSQRPAASPSGGSSSTGATPFNAADVMFVQGMIPHHQQAVEMSDTLLKKAGITADTTALAQQIRAAQQPEIATMEDWLKTWGKRSDVGMGGMDHMGGGMATRSQLEAFDRASGSAAEKLYLEMMIRHHEGAIMMARAELRSGRSTDVVQLAKNIISSQEAEITTMKSLLAAL